MLSQLLKIGRRPDERSAQLPAEKNKGNVPQHRPIDGINRSAAVW